MPMFDTIALLGDVGGGEMLIVGVIALLLFGKNLPTQARNIGKAIGEFKKTLNEAHTEIKKEMDNAAREVETATKDAKIGESLSEIKSSFKDDHQSSYHSTPAQYPVPAPVAAERPMGLDSPGASSLHGTVAHTEKARAPIAVSNAAALDNLERNIPAPTKIPPPLV